MNQYTARKLIAQRWMTLWPSLSSSTPYAFDDDPCDKAASYAILAVEFGDELQRTFGQPGNRKFTCPGEIEFELYAAPATGKKRLDEMIGYVKSMFDSVAFGTGDDLIQCFTISQYGYSSKGSSAAVGSSGQHAFSMLSVDFEHYEVR